MYFKKKSNQIKSNQISRFLLLFFFVVLFREKFCDWPDLSHAVVQQWTKRGVAPEKQKKVESSTEYFAPKSNLPESFDVADMLADNVRRPGMILFFFCSQNKNEIKNYNQNKSKNVEYYLKLVCFRTREYW